MKKLLIWSARNPKKAKLLIAFIQITIAVLGFIIGNLLNQSGIYFGLYFLVISFGFLIIGILLYPSDKALKQEAMLIGNTFKRRNLANTFLSLVIFILPMNMSTFNKADMLHYKDFVPKTFAEQRIYSSSIENPTETQQLKQKIKHSFIFLTTPVNKNKKIYNILIIIVATLVVAFLLYELWLLLCSIYCFSTITTAIFLGIAGLWGIIGPVIAYIIYKSKPKIFVPKDTYSFWIRIALLFLIISGTFAALIFFLMPIFSVTALLSQEILIMLGVYAGIVLASWLGYEILFRNYWKKHNLYKPEEAKTDDNIPEKK